MFNNSQILSTIPVTGGYGGDTENIDLTALSLDKTKILIPTQTTFGFGIGNKRMEIKSLSNLKSWD